MRRISAVLEGSWHSAGALCPAIRCSASTMSRLDEIDYQALTAHRYVRIQIKRADGSQREEFVKTPGIRSACSFEDSLICNPRTCGNHCLFCLWISCLPVFASLCI